MFNNKNELPFCCYLSLLSYYLCVCLNDLTKYCQDNFLSVCCLLAISHQKIFKSSAQLRASKYLYPQQQQQQQRASDRCISFVYHKQQKQKLFTCLSFCNKQNKRQVQSLLPFKQTKRNKTNRKLLVCRELDISASTTTTTKITFVCLFVGTFVSSSSCCY